MPSEPDPGEESVNGAANEGEAEKQPYWKMRAFGVLCVFDLVFSAVFLTPLFGYIVAIEGDSKRLSFYRNLLDLGFLSLLRLISSGLALLVSYYKQPPERTVERFRPNGERKTKEELEQEAIEEPWWPWAKRFLQRPSLTTEVLAIVTQLVCVVKCLYRMNVEIGDLHDTRHFHPVFWLAIFVAAIVSVIEASYLDEICRLTSKYAKEHGDRAPAILRTISSQLIAPLLEPHADEEQPEQAPEEETEDENAPAISDIGPDTDYKAQWSDLLMMCYPDLSYIIMAFVFLLLAAIAQVYIPRFLGKILDALAIAFANTDDNSDMDMWEVPHFMKNVKWLVVASILAGVFSGLRGSIFTVVGARVNVRLRVKLMDSLLSQDMGFFDVTKTGDITSRLSSDTTLVGDQVSLNVNVFLRSLVQAIGVLIFMFVVSWQLSVLAFISVPLITVFSKWYGNYVRALTKVMQKKLADGNATSEAALGSMPTVRAFDAAEHELREFEDSMAKYLNLNFRSAVAYFGYATLSTSMPQLVYAVVVYFGGMLVRNGDMTSGDLVSFLLYLQSLSDAFSTIGWVFSSLTQAVGAADKVFELMHRKPRMRIPETENSEEHSRRQSGILGIEATKVRQQRTRGIRPENPRGAVELEDVTMYYPARPNRRVLNGMSLKVEPGSIVALVGQSGGGKSSVMSLIQHLYEPSSGRVMLDGVDVRELSPAWMARAIATVSQEPTLFGRSIKRNIIYGLEGTDEEPTDEGIVEAAKLANAHNFIENMPQKYDTDVGEHGVQLSGGQKQRIAIARALVRKPRVLLLDEATSALDAESEHLVQQAIDDMIERGKQDREHSMTVIIVAHRLSTVRSADCIFVVREGEVVESGQHDALVAKNGAYATLIKRQMQAQEKLENGAS